MVIEQLGPYSYAMKSECEYFLRDLNYTLNVSKTAGKENNIPS